jgi:hypothetical protein
MLRKIVRVKEEGERRANGVRGRRAGGEREQARREGRSRREEEEEGHLPKSKKQFQTKESSA